MVRSLIVCLCGVVLVAGCGPEQPSGPGDVPGVDAAPDYGDADGDTISDEHEGRATNLDTDGDGTPDYLDDDSDGDGILDNVEAGDESTSTRPIDSDGDGTPNFQDLDSDGNGRPDSLDGVEDLDGDGLGNYADLDDDGDLISDVQEIGPSPTMPLDTDSDATPNFQDTDSDNDTIKDLHEGAVDGDGDMTPAYLDSDADGDCLPDAVEAGDSDLETLPIDTDGDTKYDFLDNDSDNDGLADGSEDSNCNGQQDGNESSPTNGDSDGDGASDLVENAAGTDPNNNADNPQANGDFVFEVPYEAAPTPSEDTLDFATDIVQADVVFSMDTTGSMLGEINNLKTSLVTLINTIRGDVPNTGFAVAGYDDFPSGLYGSAVSGDSPFYLLHRAMTTNTTAGLNSVQAAVDTLTTHNGMDIPESGWEMLYQVATGMGTTQGSASVPAFDSATAVPGATPPAGEQYGDIGGAGIRPGSLPVVVWITDAPSHNGVDGDDYAGIASATYTSATAALLGISARVIGVVSGADGRPDALHAVTSTGAVVPPAAWGPEGVRPAGCSVGQCCTGIDGAGELPNSTGSCPLLFTISDTGAGLGAAVATAVRVLTGFAMLDVSAEPQDDPSDAVDAVAAFVQRVEANVTAGAPCAQGLTAIDTDGDTVADTFQSVPAGQTVCFDVVPRTNNTVPATSEPQMYRATIVVSGDGVTVLDERTVFFIVPPVIPDVPID